MRRLHGRLSSSIARVALQWQGRGGARHEYEYSAGRAGSPGSPRPEGREALTRRDCPVSSCASPLSPASAPCRRKSAAPRGSPPLSALDTPDCGDAGIGDDAAGLRVRVSVFVTILQLWYRVVP